MKCMFKSLVALFLVLFVACSVGMAEEVDFDYLKPYLTQDEAIMLAQNVDSMIRYTVDEEENILFEGESTHEVNPMKMGTVSVTYLKQSKLSLSVMNVGIHLREFAVSCTEWAVRLNCG